MKKYGVVLIGCGHIGKEHLEEIYDKENIKVIAVIDKNVALAKEMAEKHGVSEYAESYEKYLCDDRVDIAIVATYTATHAKITADFLNKGKHVLCEKPVAPTLEQGLAFFKTARESNSKAMVAHILRVNRSYIKIKEMIDNGEIGKLLLFRMAQNQYAADWNRFKCLLQDCTPVLDCGVHYFDVSRWFTGSEFAKISGFKTKLDADSPNYNYTCVNFELENGCVGIYEVGWGKNVEQLNLKQFIGEKGRITLTLEKDRTDVKGKGDLITVFHGETGILEKIDMPSKYKDMYAQLCYFINVIEGKTDKNINLNNSEKAFKTAIAGEYAAKTGKTVYFKNGEPIF